MKQVKKEKEKYKILKDRVEGMEVGK